MYLDAWICVLIQLQLQPVGCNIALPHIFQLTIRYSNKLASESVKHQVNAIAYQLVAVVDVKQASKRGQAGK